MASGTLITVLGDTSTGRDTGPSFPAPQSGHGLRDEDLARAAQQGDAASFGHLYERYFDKIHRYLSSKVGNVTEAEDLAEQVFVKALTSIGGYRWMGVRFQAWLFRIAHNHFVDYVRGRPRRAGEPLDESLPDQRPAADPETWLAEKVTREGLISAVDQLTDLQKQVIAWKFAGGLSNAEVAQLLGKTVGAVKALQHAGLQALHRQLAKGRVS